MLIALINSRLNKLELSFWLVNYNNSANLLLKVAAVLLLISFWVGIFFAHIKWSKANGILIMSEIINYKLGYYYINNKIIYYYYLHFFTWDCN